MIAAPGRLLAALLLAATLSACGAAYECWRDHSVEGPVVRYSYVREGFMNTSYVYRNLTADECNRLIAGATYEDIISLRETGRIKPVSAAPAFSSTLSAWVTEMDMWMAEMAQAGLPRPDGKETE